ncbi:MAG: hypothetical protein WC996_03290 [Peptostreptococcales bacterium]
MLLKDKKTFPYAEELHEGYLILGKDLNIIYSANKLSVSEIKHSISGTFQWQNNVCSILIKDGIPLGRTSSHKYTMNAPESLIARLIDGSLVYRSEDYLDNEKLKEYEWAVGGLGLVDYNPVKEGFVGKYSEVLDDIGHTGLGITHDDDIVCLYKKCSAAEFRDWAMNKLELKYAIMLDSGTIAAINTGEKVINGNQKQNNILQVIG